MNEKKVKLDYVGVLSSKPASQAYRSTFKYFGKYLITLGEPTAAPSWTLMQILKHAKNIIIDEHIPDAELMVDSGGYQIIVNKITKYRILEYIECFHMVLDMYPDKIQKIFSLDINNLKMSAKEILQWNEKSTGMTIESIEKHPALKEKVLFVIQNRNRKVFEIWRELMLRKEVWNHFDLYSIGGLVGLKKETKVNFNHAVPATMWLLTYSKHFNFDVKQLHWLGQSSKVVFIAMALLEKLYGIYLTSDSSELIRFAPLAQKLPLIRKDVKYDEGVNEFIDDFCYATDNEHVLEMLKIHSWDDDKCLRANRINLRHLDIDRDVLNVIPQDILDYMIFVHIFGAKQEDKSDILNIMVQNKSKIESLVKSLYRLCNNVKIHKEDLELLRFQHDDKFVDTWNVNIGLDRDSYLVLGDSFVKLFDTIYQLKNFKYKDQRSTFALEFFEKTKRKRLDNGDYFELMCQHIESAILVADIISTSIIKIGLDNCNIENLKDIHPIMVQGKTAQTTLENIQWILKFIPCLEKGDINEADILMRNLVDSYEK